MIRSIGSTAPRRATLILLLAVGVYLLIPRLAGVSDALSVVRHASALPLLAALSCQVLSVICHTYVVHQVLLVLGPGVDFRNLLQLVLASGFAAMFLPFCGLSSMAVRHRYLDESGYALEATLLALTLEMLGQGVGHSILLSLALLRQTLLGHPAPWRHLMVLMGMVLLGCAALAVLLSSRRSRDWRYALLELVNRLRTRWGRSLLLASALERRLNHLRQAVLALNTSTRLGLLLGSLLRNLGGALCLHFTLLAFSQKLPLHLTVISYVLSDVLGGMSTLPGGLLVTETSLSAMLLNAGVTLSAAIAVTLTFRLLAFWLPRAMGVMTWYNVQKHSSRPLW